MNSHTEQRNSGWVNRLPRTWPRSIRAVIVVRVFWPWILFRPLASTRMPPLLIAAALRNGFWCNWHAFGFRVAICFAAALWNGFWRSWHAFGFRFLICFGSNWFLGNPIKPNPTRKITKRYDRNVYKHRNRIERFFGRLKRCRRVATRYEKKVANFAGFIWLAALITDMI